MHNAVATETVVTLVRDNVVRAPVSAVFPLPDRDDGPGGMAVFELRDGRAHLTRVRLGGRNAADAWVHQGLAPGASVVINPPSSVKDGARVEVRSVSSAR